MKRKEKCAYCGSSEQLTNDHIVPLRLHKQLRIPRRLLDTAGNQVRCCNKCNQEKGGMSPFEWFKRHPEFKSHFLHHAKYISDPVRWIIENNHEVAISHKNE